MPSIEVLITLTLRVYFSIGRRTFDHRTFDFYVIDGLSNFNSLPIWKRITTHNIRRKTPQNSACNSCLGNKELFLLKKGIELDYLEANGKDIVAINGVPEKIK